MHKCNTDVNDKGSEVFATRSLGQEIFDEERVWRSSKQVVLEPLGTEQSRDLTRSPRHSSTQTMSQACFPAGNSSIIRTLQNSTCSLTQALDQLSMHLMVQFQRSLRILSYVRTCPECSRVCTVFSHVCHMPTHPFVGSLVPAECSLLSRSTDCQHINSRIARSKSNSSVRSKLADKDSSHPSHIQFGPIFRMVSSLADLSEWHNFTNVVLASKTTIWRSPRSFHLKIVQDPCTVPNHPTHWHMSSRSYFCFLFQ